MKKWIAIFVLLVLAVSLFYYLIPGKISVSQTTTISVNAKAFARQILDEQNWAWWPSPRPPVYEIGEPFTYKGNQYSITQKNLTSLTIRIEKGNDSIVTELIFLPIRADTMKLSWEGTAMGGANPLTRFKKSFWIKSVDHDLQAILGNLRSFYSNEDNVYGLHIEKTHVTDSNYIFTSRQSKNYPSTIFVYSLVAHLKQYVHANKAKELGSPMLNVFKVNDTSYITKVALPVDIKLKDSGDIRYRWMLKGGNILAAEVHGGPFKVERAFSELQNYIQDHDRTSPAIPFQSLITERTQEPDTNKWVTKVWWPVM